MVRAGQLSGGAIVTRSDTIAFDFSSMAGVAGSFYRSLHRRGRRRGRGRQRRHDGDQTTPTCILSRIGCNPERQYDFVEVWGSRRYRGVVWRTGVLIRTVRVEMAETAQQSISGNAGGVLSEGVSGVLMPSARRPYYVAL